MEACSQSVKDKDALITLEAAKQVGKLFHANIEKEAQSVIEKMVQSKNLKIPRK